MSNTIMLRPEDIQAIVAGLAANNDALATMAHMMSNPTPPRETPLDQPPSSSSGQGSSSGKLLFSFVGLGPVIIRTKGPPSLT